MMFTLYHGENTLERDEALAQWVKQGGDPEMAAMNTERLAPPLTLAALQSAAAAMPFLADWRTIMVRNALSGRGNEKLSREIAAWLPNLPPSARLIFIEDQSLSAKHPVLTLAQQPGQADLRHFPMPDVKSLPDWIRRRARQHGTDIQPQAAALLAQNLGPDLHRQDQELQKLILYRGDKSPITVEDVQCMVPYIEHADVIFQMVDAVGQRQTQKAVQHLHRLLDGEQHPLGIFGMLVRQFRLLIQVRWMLDHRAADVEIAQRLKLQPFIVQKIHGQATQFTMAQLNQAYRLLLESDLAIKRGQLAPDVALDLLIARLTRL